MVAKIKPLQSAELRLVGNLERLIADAVDDTGAPTVQYELWAKNVLFAIDDWRPTEAFLAQSQEGQLSTRLTIRYRPGLEGIRPNTMRLAYTASTGDYPATVDYYHIIGAVRDPTTRVQLTLTCVRRDAPGFRTGVTP